MNEALSAQKQTKPFSVENGTSTVENGTSNVVTATQNKHNSLTAGGASQGGVHQESHPGENRPEAACQADASASGQVCAAHHC